MLSPTCHQFQFLSGISLRVEFGMASVADLTDETSRQSHQIPADQHTGAVLQRHRHDRHLRLLCHWKKQRDDNIQNLWYGLKSCCEINTEVWELNSYSQSKKMLIKSLLRVSGLVLHTVNNYVISQYNLFTSTHQNHLTNINSIFKVRHYRQKQIFMHQLILRFGAV